MSLDTMKKGLLFAVVLSLGVAAGVDAEGASAEGFALDVGVAGVALVLDATPEDGIVTWDLQDATRWDVALGAASLPKFVRT